MKRPKWKPTTWLDVRKQLEAFDKPARFLALDRRPRLSPEHERYRTFQLYEVVPGDARPSRLRELWEFAAEGGEDDRWSVLADYCMESGLIGLGQVARSRAVSLSPVRRRLRHVDTAVAAVADAIDYKDGLVCPHGFRKPAGILMWLDGSFLVRNRRGEEFSPRYDTATPPWEKVKDIIVHGMDWSPVDWDAAAARWEALAVER